MSAIADLKSSKANQSELNNWELGFGIGLGVLQAQCVLMDVFIGLNSTGLAANVAATAGNSALIVAL